MCLCLRNTTVARSTRALPRFFPSAIFLPFFPFLSFFSPSRYSLFSRAPRSSNGESFSTMVIARPVVASRISHVDVFEREERIFSSTRHITTPRSSRLLFLTQYLQCKLLSSFIRNQKYYLILKLPMYCFVNKKEYCVSMRLRLRKASLFN